MKREKFATWFFLLVALICMIAALVPIYRGRPMNVTSFAAGAFWVIVALAIAAKQRKRASSGNDPVE